MKNTGLLLLLCLMLSVAAAGSAVAEEAVLPRVGDEVSGFVVTSVMPMEPLGATGILFEHAKTGAQLLYLATEDTNRSFDITFRTPALDETGKPHVFEHMTICGSQKYSDPNLFFPFVNKTYNTFVNAFTYEGMTSYPLASLSEEQLMTMMDYYLSGVFSPLVYTEPRMVEREAWRYELADADAPLTIAGTVYSEMQGALTISAQAGYDSMSALFRDGLTSHVSGGRPEAIRTLTQQALIDFHDAYYHPSNALILLYGKLDYARFMTLIDQDYLSRFEKADISVEKGRVEPYRETAYLTCDAPVEAGAQTENASYLYYAFGADGAQLEDSIRLSLLSTMLSQESSPLMIALRQALPNANIAVSLNSERPVPVLSIVASGVNESDRDLFVSTVDDCLAKLAQEGFAPADLDALLSAAKMSLLLTAEDQNLGVNAGQNIALHWAYFDRVDYYSVYETIVNEMSPEEMLNTLNQWMTNNTYRAVSVTRPVAGLAEENAAMLEAELAQVKAAMTPEEIDAMVRQTADFAAWSSASPAPELMEQLATVTPQTLPVELVTYNIADEQTDGVRFVTSEAKVNGVASLQLALDGSGIPVDQLQDAALFLNLLGKLDTDRHTKEELSSLTLRYLNGFSARLNAQNRYDQSATALYTAKMSYVTLREDVPTSVALLAEMLFSSDLSDAETIRQYLNREIASFAQTLDGNALSVQIQRLLATFSPSSAYVDFVSDFDFYAYQKSLLALSDSDLTARLEAARECVLNRYQAIVTCAGDAETIAAVRAEMQTLLAQLPSTERAAVDYASLYKDIGWEAVTVNSTVQMNLLAGSPDGYTGRDAVIAALLNDVYLLPKLRNALGAYGAYSVFTPFYQCLYTYRDPNLTSTFEAFEALPEFLQATELTQDMVDAYIVGSYTSLSRPQGALSGAVTAISNHLLGLSDETRLQWMREAKQTTVEDVRATAERVQALLENGVRSTSATASTIEEHQALFTSVVRLDDADQ